MLKQLRRWLFGGSPTPGASFAPERPADPPPVATSLRTSPDDVILI